MKKKTKRRVKMSYETKTTRKITKIGGYSYCVTLPMDIVKKFRWKERQRVELTINEKKKEITIKDYVP